MQGGRRIASPNQRSRAAGTSGAASRSRTATRTAGGAAAAKSARAKQRKNLINYPRAGKTGAWKWVPSLRLLALLASLFVIAGIGYAVWLYNDTEIPEASDVALAQTSRVYFSDGKTLMGEFSDIDRTILPEDQIPQNIKDAVVASEDSTFYENRGVSPKGIMRALVNNLQGGAQQGGSTITQQYVERYYTGTVTDYEGKVREMIMAIKADQELSKDQILARYLNTIYFGRSAYGVQAASKAYFGKNAKDLTKEEAALLVAVIPAPTAYDPMVNPKKSQQLWARVINRQVNDTKTLKPAEADAMKFPKVIQHKPKNKLGGTNGYLLDTVKRELHSKGMTMEEIDKGGYKIVSTIDPTIQKHTVDAINGLPEDRPADNRVGTITMDPKTGAIVAMYGGPNYVKQARNDATQSRMQAGSIFKSFTLVAAIEDGYSLRSTWNGNSPQNFKGWTVKNFNDKSYGTVDLLKSTQNSINTSFAALNIDMGADKTREAAIKLGLPEKTPGLDADVTNVLGTASPTVREMASAYATLAAGGMRHEPYVVAKVVNADGSTKYAHKDSAKRAVDEDVATNVTVALQRPTSEGGSARTIAQEMDGRPVAGKTGTSEKFRSAWFVGYTPQYVTAVGMFQPSPDGKTEQELTPFGGKDNITGSTFPTELWIGIMKPTLEGKEKVDFPEEVRMKRAKQGNKPKVEKTKAPEKEEQTEQEQPKEDKSEAPKEDTQAPAAPAPKPEAPEPTKEPEPTKAPATTQAPAPSPTKAPATTSAPKKPGATKPNKAPTTAPRDSTTTIQSLGNGNGGQKSPSQ